MLFGEPLVLIDCVDARNEVGDIEGCELFFAVTQRLKLERSAARKCHGEKRDGYGLLAPKGGE